MVRRLPCPVCGCESFIESVTQGGLICSDCGAVSNQVEIADDEDAPIAGNRTFISALAYKHVTEEESKARRERKVVVGIRDKRTADDILHGYGLLLDHMIDACIAKGLCPNEARDAVRETWFDFLTAVAESDLSAFFSQFSLTKWYLDCMMAKWGIRSNIREVVTRCLPTERRKQYQALRQLLEDRQLFMPCTVLYDKAPLSIYAHDWLCHFLNLDKFPIPDWVLRDYQQNGISWRFICAIRLGESRLLRKQQSGTLTQQERRRLVREMFADIIQNDSIRLKHCGIDSEEKETRIFITPQTFLSVILVALRRVNISMLPVHILNWVARGDLPFFTAHKCLSAPLDRIEYYHAERTAHGYRHSIFRPHNCPSVKDIEAMLITMESIGLDVAIRDPVGLLTPCLDMMGLLALKPLCMQIIAYVNSRADEHIFGPYPVHALSKLSRYRYTVKDFYIAGDTDLYEYMLAIIAVAMKLVFPALHPGDESSPPIVHPLLGLVPTEPLEYAIMSPRFSNKQCPTVDISWWDKLNENERNQFLHFVETENLGDMRESMAEDLRLLLDPNWENRSLAVETDKLVSGKLTRYTRCCKTGETGLMKYLLMDLEKICGVISPGHAQYAVYQLELFLFPPPKGVED